MLGLNADLVAAAGVGARLWQWRVASFIVAGVKRSKRLVREALPNNLLTLASEGSCSLNGGECESGQIKGGGETKKASQPSRSALELARLAVCSRLFPTDHLRKFNVQPT